jgi:hypothetical protein
MKLFFKSLFLKEQIKKEKIQFLLKRGKKSVKNLFGFLGDLKTPKFHSEINRPLISRFKDLNK